MGKRKRNFLRTKEWRELRDNALGRDGHRCFLCGRTDQLCVHHIRYRRFHKRLEDKLFNLVTLCKSCHWKVHKSSANIELTLKLKAYRPEQLRQLLAEGRDSGVLAPLEKFSEKG